MAMQFEADRFDQLIYIERDMRGDSYSKHTTRNVRTINREANYLFGWINLYGKPCQVFRTDDYPKDEWDLIK